MSDTEDGQPSGVVPRARRRVRRESAEIGPGEVPVFVGSFIVKADGTIEHASVESRLWLGVRGFERAMTAFVAALAAPSDGRTPTNPFAPYAEASGVRLIGSDAPLRFHVRVRPLFASTRNDAASGASRR